MSSELWLSQEIGRVHHFLTTLEKDWDSYEGDPPSLESAYYTIIELFRLYSEEYDRILWIAVVPAPYGGYCIEGGYKGESGSSICIEIYSDGSVDRSPT